MTSHPVPGSQQSGLIEYSSSPRSPLDGGSPWLAGTAPGLSDGLTHGPIALGVPRGPDATWSIQGREGWAVDAFPDPAFPDPAFPDPSATVLDSITSASFSARQSALVDPGQPWVGAEAIDLHLADFSDLSQWTLNGTASEVEGRLRLTDALQNQAGSALLSEAIALDSETSFTSYFQFQISAGNGPSGAAGLTFLLQNTAQGPQFLGNSGAGMGYGATGSGSIAIEFDTFAPKQSSDPNANHIALIRDGNIGDHLQVATPTLDLNGGTILHAWVVYEGSSDLLSVYLNDQPIQPTEALLSASLNLPEILGNQAYVGFSAGTGGLSNVHEIQSWSFSTQQPAPVQSTVFLSTPSLVISEAGNEAVISVMRSGAVDSSISVDYTTVDGTAIAGADYQAKSGTLTFAPHEVLKQIVVPILNDALPEANEQFRLMLFNEVNAVLGSPRELLFTLEDEDDPLILNGSAALVEGALRLTDAQINQAGAALLPTAWAITPDTSFESYFQFRIFGGDASSGASGLTFFLQNTSAGVQFLGNAGGGMGYGATGSGSLAVEFDTFAPAQRSSDPNNNHVALLRDGSIHNHLALATPDQDLNSGEVFHAWVTYNGTSNQLAVYLADQGNRPATPLWTSPLDLQAVVGNQAYVGWSAGTGGRHNIHEIQQWSFSTQASPVDSTLALAVNALQVSEADPQAVLSVIRTGSTDQVATLDYATADDTAIAGLDYVAQSGTLIFMPGETSKQIVIPLLNDSIDEPDEQFSLAIGHESNALLGVPRTAIITLKDDDQPSVNVGFQFSQAVYSVQEGVGEATIVVERTGDVSQFAAVRYATQNDEARSGHDYQSVAGLLSFAPDQTTQTFTVPIMDDALPEIGEDITLKLFDAQQVTLALGEARLRLEDNDTHPFTVRSQTVVPSLGTGRRSGITAFDWTPDGSAMLIGQASGIVFVYEHGAVQPQAFYNFSHEIARDTTLIGQGGLMGVAIHPQFAAHPYVYLAFSASSYDPPGPIQVTTPHSFVMRVEADPATGFRTALPGSEQLLLAIPTNDTLFHATGGLRFGEDGSLFYSHGDSSLAVTVEAGAFRALDLDDPQGKLFRINPLTGQGYADNPFATSDLNAVRSKVYSYGLRNPFRFAIQPGTNEPFISDVGQSTWEELNSGRGQNFGWPLFEGGLGVSLRQPANANRPSLQALYDQFEATVQAPIYARRHDDNAAAIMAGDFYTGQVYPDIYNNALFFGDFVFDEINALLFDDQGNVDSVTPFTLEDDVVYMAQGPDGLLYYADLSEGTVNRWIIE
ncbi:Calx-beta domain-containing protein [Lyngbya confervoides]|uniref:PQQ-dependent sugar dehydrogenase n=1 Tax=Lyngbya confervoides BDU141951 TaxID=1574623 RepID=A0ABD4T5D6_9CYAN|nr:Calx-beta domain-containing protein [Lyngbya confervoides]MCM1984006.1 PQQ-dependent sugar dehydrogenase [Lyngbya confervoides BDU141951]